MQYVRLGNSDLQVSRICLGCMGFGDAKNGQHSWTIDETGSREIIRQALELGINFLTPPRATRTEPANNMWAGPSGILPGGKR